MDLGTVLSVAQTLFASLQCSELKELSSFFGVGCKSQLEELQDTVSTVKAVLQDAEIKQDQLSSEAQLWIQKLKDAVYDADDLFDEFVTLVKQKQLIKGQKLSEKSTDRRGLEYKIHVILICQHAKMISYCKWQHYIQLEKFILCPRPRDNFYGYYSKLFWSVFSMCVGVSA